jgi:AraC-like DNA-binding protein
LNNANLDHSLLSSSRHICYFLYATDGTQSQDEQLEMLIFYAGTFGYIGKLDFVDNKGISISVYNYSFIIVIIYINTCNMASIDDDESTTKKADILKVCKNGCTKEKIIEETHLSHDQLRRITAEMTDKQFLQYIEHTRVYITTDKGYIFLNSVDK